MVRLYTGLLAFLGSAAGFVFAGIAVMVTLDVVLRNLGLGNFPWLFDVTEYALYAATFLAAPWVLSLGAHVRVDVIVGHVPMRLARRLEILADLLGLAIVAFLFRYGLGAYLSALQHGSIISKEIVVAEHWMLIFLPISTFLLLVEFLRRLWRALRHKQASPTGADAARSGY